MIAEALSAGERERRALAEGLHDQAIQNLLSARHDLEEVAESGTLDAHEALARADAAVEATIAELREAVFELHPYVLEQSGLEAALRAAGQRAARRGVVPASGSISPIPGGIRRRSLSSAPRASCSRTRRPTRRP